MIFGLAGRALLVDSKVAPAWSFFGALLAGFLAMWLVGLVFYVMQRMQSSGTLVVANAVGKEGSVYLTIPSGSTGQVQLVFQNKQHVWDAVSAKKKEIPTGVRVKVVGLTGNNVLIVEPLK
jgi:membrane protein implicated in regulation of membrane protease activity